MAQSTNPLPAGGQKEPASRQMTFVASHETQAYVRELAERSGRSQSQVIEFIIMQWKTVERVLAFMDQTLEEAQRQGVEKIFRDHGYVPMRSSKGTAWFPPGFPLKRSGFINPEENK